MPLEPVPIVQSLFEPAMQRKILSAIELFPNDIVAEFDEAMSVPDAIGFAITMLLRSHEDFETTMLSTINMGGLASLTGAIVGGAMGLLHSEAALPAQWVAGMEHSEEIQALL